MTINESPRITPPKELQEAFLTLLGNIGSASAEARQSAQTYLDQFVQSEKGWEVCWRLFLQLSSDELQQKGSSAIPLGAEIRFWCVQTVSSRVSSLTPEQRNELALSLRETYIAKVLAKQGGAEEAFVLNRALGVYVNIIAADYTCGDNDLISSWLQLIEQARSQNASQEVLVLTESFVKLLLLLDAHVIADEIASRSEEERAVAMRIKDRMREGDLELCLKLFAAVLDGSLMSLPSNESRVAHVKWCALAAAALLSLAHITAWADTALLVDQRFGFLPFLREALQCSLGRQVAEASLNVLNALIYKKMEGAQKALLDRCYGLSNMLLEAVPSVIKQGAVVNVAKSLNLVALQLLEALLDVRDRHLSNRTPPVMSAYVLTLSLAEAMEAVNQLWGTVAQKLLPALLEILGGVALEAAEEVLPALQEFYRILRLPQVGLPGIPRDLLAATLLACQARTTLPRTIDLKSLAEREDDFFDQDEDDGSDLSKFFVVRKAALVLFRRAYSVGLAPSLKVSDEFTIWMEGQVNTNSHSGNWQAVEASLALSLAALDAFKDGLVTSKEFGLPSRLIKCFAAWDILREGCPALVRRAYFELLASLAVSLKGDNEILDAEKSQFVQEAYSALLGPYGVRAPDCIRTTACTIRSLLRLTKALPIPVSPEIMIPLIEATSPQFSVVMQTEFTFRQSLADASTDEASPRTLTPHPNIPSLALEDQMRLFEFLGLISLPPANKGALLKSIVSVLLSEVPKRLLQLTTRPTQNSVEQALYVDWVSRTLRCTGNLLKGYNDLAGETQPVSLLLQFLVSSVDLLGHSVLVLTNAAFVMRRLISACEIGQIRQGLVALLPLLTESLFKVAAEQTTEVPAKLVLGLDQNISLLSLLCARFKMAALTGVLLCEVQSGAFQGQTVLSAMIKGHKATCSALSLSAESIAAQVELYGAIQTMSTRHADLCCLWWLVSLIPAVAYFTPASQSPAAATPPFATPGGVVPDESSRECSIIGLLYEGVHTASGGQKLKHMAAASIQGYMSLLTALYCDEKVFSNLREAIGCLRSTNPGLAQSLESLPVMAASDLTAFLSGISAKDLSLELMLGEVVKSLLQTKDRSGPAPQRVLQELGCLLKFIWSGKVLGSPKKTAEAESYTRAMLEPLRQSATQLFAPNDKNFIDFATLLEADKRTENVRECKNCTALWVDKLFERFAA